MTLSGIDAYTGTTTVNAGTLIVDGSIASSIMTTVNGGATLGGSGTVGSTLVTTGGTLAPGPSGTPGTMTVAGNLAFQSGAFYLVQVNPSTASSTNVTGAASLAGTVQAIFAPGTYGLVRSYTILTAAGGRIGTFDALTTSGLPADFQASLSHPGNSAVLNLTAALVPEPPQLSAAAFTVNQLNVGHAIDNFFNNGGALPPAFLSLFNLTGSNLTNALDQLSGEPATGAQKVAFQLTDQFLNVMLDPFVDGRCGIGRTDQPPLGRDCEMRPPALGFAPERETVPSEIALAPLKDEALKDPDNPIRDFHIDMARVEHGYPLSRQDRMKITTDNLRTLSQEQVDQIYGQLTAGPFPDGQYSGKLFFERGETADEDNKLRTRLGEILGGPEGRLIGIKTELLEKFGSYLWKGKVFFRDQRVLRNMIQDDLALWRLIDNPLGVMTTTIPRSGPLREFFPTTDRVWLLFPAKLYCGQSLLDTRRESVIVDYHFADDIEGYRARPDSLAGRGGLRIRDEIRMVRPGFYLGRAYANRMFLLNFTLFNADVAERGAQVFESGGALAEDCWPASEQIRGASR